jgi:hypothetical protein
VKIPVSLWTPAYDANGEIRDGDGDERATDEADENVRVIGTVRVRRAPDRLQPGLRVRTAGEQWPWPGCTGRSGGTRSPASWLVDSCRGYLPTSRPASVPNALRVPPSLTSPPGSTLRAFPPRPALVGGTLRRYVRSFDESQPLPNPGLLLSLCRVKA